MRDPAYLIVLFVILVAGIDHFLLNGAIVNYFGHLISSAANWMADLIPG